ncbi:3'-5' exonuclease [Desulfococcaceae bacterium HSG8]|nr:3'-5' exonuclease [Desulfococcaceae bacterium HSG8]
MKKNFYECNADVMTYIIVDFEATCCDRGTVPRNEMEIIEIGAVALDGEGPAVAGEFSEFIRPVRNPRLTRFCTELTGITQEMLEGASGFKKVLFEFKKWIWSFEKPVFCSWGEYDRVQLERDCAYHSVPYPFDYQHINIKKKFAYNNELRKACGLGQAIRMAGLEFNGRHHRGIDDAKNMARLSEFIFGSEICAD